MKLTQLEVQSLMGRKLREELERRIEDAKNQLCFALEKDAVAEAVRTGELRGRVAALRSLLKIFVVGPEDGPAESEDEMPSNVEGPAWDLGEGE